MNLTKDERTVKCKLKLKRGMITNNMISVQSEISNAELEAMQKFNSCVVKLFIECFGQGQFGEYTSEVHIDNILDNTYSVELSSAETDAMYNLSTIISYVRK